GSAFMNSYASLDAIRCDRQGNIYFGGTGSGGYPSTNAEIVTPRAHPDTNTSNLNKTALLVKFNSTGVRQWPSYYRGSGFTMITDIVTDNNNMLYIMGTTSSSSMIATVGSHKPTTVGVNGSTKEMFVAKFTQAGVRLWGTYYGGSGDEVATRMAINTEGTKLYIAGVTQSDTGIATPGSHQATRAGGYDMFVAEMDSSGKRLWGSYYGGTGIESMEKRLNSLGSIIPQINGGICIDCMGRMYMAGRSNRTIGI